MEKYTDFGWVMYFPSFQRIWERFYQVPERIVYGGSSGMGLGLYLSQAIIGLHHGEVDVESEPDQGARFWFTLPLP